MNGRRLVARRGIVIAAGTQPAIPAIDGIDFVAYWTNREATEADPLPRSLLNLGAAPSAWSWVKCFGDSAST